MFLPLFLAIIFTGCATEVTTEGFTDSTDSTTESTQTTTTCPTGIEYFQLYWEMFKIFKDSQKGKFGNNCENT